MPSIRENLEHWNRGYAWPEDGDEWSVGAGGTPYVWHGTIMPRICRFVPCGHVLELGPGHGRFTERLLGLCERLTGVDLAERCTEFCRGRFASDRRARFFTNDGLTLPMVEDGSVDFVFSWDSLVHAERDVIGSYLRELRAKLRPGGAGLIHHSNLGHYLDEQGRPTVEKPGWRATSMTWEAFQEACRAAGLWCVCQEPRTFAQPQMIDCISLFARADEDRPTEVFRNDEFYRETHNLNRIARMYRLEPQDEPPAAPGAPGSRPS